MYFKNEIMSYIQLGKTLEKSLNRSGEGHRGRGVMHVPQLLGPEQAAGTKLTPRGNGSMPEAEDRARVCMNLSEISSSPG